MLRCGLVVVCLLAVVSASLVNERVLQRIHLQTNIARVQADVTLRNDGAGSVSSFDWSLPENLAGHISDYKAESEGTDLDVSLIKSGVIAVSLAKPLSSGSTARVSLLAAFTHVLSPFPTHISQMETPLYVFETTQEWLSPYATESVTTEVLVPSKVEGSTESDVLTTKGNTLVYGPLKNVKADSTPSPLRVHFDSIHPFFTITSLEKEIEVSHWGHLSYEEHVDLYHSGPELEGGFSRLDFQRNPSGSPSHFRQLVARLPAMAYNIYFRDVIGNISTSRVREEYPDEGEPYTHMELLTRYVMFGGWKTRFYFGYAEALSASLGITDDGRHSLHVPFGTSILGAVVDNATVRVILPEGVSDVQVSGIRDVRSVQYTRQTYLDTSGRVVVEMNKENIVGDNDRTLVVTYNFPRSALYHEPMLLMGGFFAVFLLFIFTGRFRMSIGKSHEN